MKDKVEVIIIEDNTLVREGFEVVLNYSRKYKVIGSYPNCEGIPDYVTKNLPKVMLMNTDRAGVEMIGFIRAIKREFPSLYLMLVTLKGESRTIHQALEAGADAYIANDINPERLIESLDNMIQGRVRISADMAQRLEVTFDKLPKAFLSAKARKALRLRANGKCENYIANSLSISPEEVMAIVGDIFKKMHLLFDMELLIIKDKKYSNP